MNQGLNDRHVSLLAKTARITAEHPRCTGRANAAHTMGAGVPSTSQQRKPRLRARGMRLMWRSPHTGRARACAQCYTPQSSSSQGAQKHDGTLNMSRLRTARKRCQRLAYQVPHGLTPRIWATLHDSHTNTEAQSQWPPSSDPRTLSATTHYVSQAPSDSKEDLH